MRIKTSERRNVDYVRLEEAMKIVASKPDESGRLRETLAVMRVQEFLESLYAMDRRFED